MSIYEVPVIPNNLRHEETVVQLADALNYLCNVFDDILIKVNNRVDVNKIRLTNLTDRINKSAEKITKLTGTKKATQVFSSSKYPAADMHRRYKSIFSRDDKIMVTFNRTKMKYKDPVLQEYPLEKLQFYHVKVSDKIKCNTNYIEEGLGSYPNDIESVNELLLFNTSKNPYKNYVMSDPLQASQYIKEINESSAPGLDAAPLSISQRTGMNRTVGENYFYSPGLGDVPTIDVPLDLPDLPGVADDLRYLMETGPGIAPSVTTTPVVPELPSIVQSPNETLTSISMDNTVIETHNKTVMNSLPPLPEPITEIMVEGEAKVEQVPKSNATNNDLISSIDIISKAKAKAEISENALPVVEDARASLMAAIRQAGGLKKANLRNTVAKKENKTSNSGGGNNLMADLSAKLALRRKGISGSKSTDSSEMNSALSKISAMIPPPALPATDLNESTNTEDEDWDE